MWHRKGIMRLVKEGWFKRPTSEEQKFINTYAGNPIIAARKAGVCGNYRTVKQIGLKLIRKPHIKVAIREKRRKKIPSLKIFSGGGQGDGKPFNICPEKIPAVGVIELTQYMSSIRNRFDERIKRIRSIHDEAEDKHRCPAANRAWKLSHMLHGYVWGDKSNYYKSCKHSDCEIVSNLIAEAEREMGISRGNYKGY